MRNAFKGYYAATPAEMDSMWTSGLIILDTNALLNLFRYSEATRKDFMGVLQEQAKSLWLPFHVGSEFHSRRIGVINDQERAIDDVKKAIDEAVKMVEESLNKLKDHPSLDIAKVKEATKAGLADASEQVEAARVRHQKSVVDSETHESTFSEITKLYEGRVGTPWNEERLTALYEDGESRYEKLIPPGFEDRKKPEPEKYGDLVIWMQILEHASATKLPAIFVTDDGKEDWWYKVSGKTLGPRPELVDEYWAQANQRIHFYTPQRFVEFAKERGAEVSDASVKEVGTVSTARRVTAQKLDRMQQMTDSSHLFTSDTEARIAAVMGLLPKYSREITSLQRELAEADTEEVARRIERHLKLVQWEERNLQLQLHQLQHDTSASARIRAYNQLARERDYRNRRMHSTEYEVDPAAETGYIDHFSHFRPELSPEDYISDEDH